jgi:cytochrome c biogenesis protein CcdA
MLYSLGLALPFIIAALFFNRLEKVFLSLKKQRKTIKIISGILLMLIGLYMMLGKIRTISGTFVIWGARLELFAQNNPLLSDYIFSLLYAAIFIVFVILRIEKRKKLKAENKLTKTAGLPLLVIGFCFGILAILEAANVISTPELITSWLRFQGI